MKEYTGPNTLLIAFRIIRQAIKSASLSAGDGLTKEGDTLSVTIPTRGIVTQAEFDALTEEQRGKGLYFVDDGANGGVPVGIYDEQERVIGTWFGKPLYQIGLQKTSLIVSSSYKNTLIKTLPDECKLVRSSGNYVFHDSNIENIYSLPYCEYDAGDFRYACLMSYNNSIILKTRLYDGWAIDLQIILEYTKTTDEGGTA